MLGVCEGMAKEVLEECVRSVLGEYMMYYVGGEHGSAIVLVVVIRVDGWMSQNM